MGDPTPVVVGSHPGSPWLADCMKTIPKNRTVKVHAAGGYEIAALRTACQEYDRFLFLQDSTEVLHSDFWKTIDSTPTAWLFGGPPMYLGIYNRKDLNQPLAEAPQTLDKRAAIEWEGLLPLRLNYPVLWPEVTDLTGRYEERHDRMNLVLENRYLRKWKGNWGQG